MADKTHRDLIAYCIQETLGDRCDTHDDTCMTCEAWGQYDAALTAGMAKMWRPIESAPRDGTEIDLWCLNWEGKGERWCRARWSGENGVGYCWVGPWSDGFDSGLPDSRLTPTHWMPLPEPPKDEQ